MLIQDNRIKMEANIGDIIITNTGKKYMLLINDGIDAINTIAIYNIEEDYIECTTQQKCFCVGGTLGKEDIVDIVPKLKIKLTIEK